MNLLPVTLGTRPRLAIELRPEGVTAARADDAAALLTAIASASFAPGTLAPGLRLGNVVRRPEAVAAVRKVLEAVALKERPVTLVVPDAAVRVLLLDFDQLPAKAAEALPVVRFRLRKLLPFDAEEANVSYQTMSSTRGLVRVLAVAIPREVLAEYESVVREAGFEPGAVLPSTVAACAGVTEIEAAVLLVNAGESAVTTAIVQGSNLLLHRTVDLGISGSGLHERMFDDASGMEEDASGVELPRLGLVDVESSAGEWARQEPLTGYGVLDDDRIAAGAHMQTQQLEAELAAELEQDHHLPRAAMLPPLPTPHEAEDLRLTAAAREITEAMSVAAAYFEDTLQTAPGIVLAAGSIGAEALETLVREAGFAAGEMRVREIVEEANLTGGATTTRVPFGWLAGVRGALRG